MRLIFRSILYIVALILRPSRWRYPQLMFFLPSKSRCERFLRPLCARLGHELSETEHGYAGGDFEDRWCRWCGQHVSVPKGKFAFEVMAGKYGLAIGEIPSEGQRAEIGRPAL